MITRFKPTSPDLKRLLGKEAIEFGPGINLIMGPNGAGKTSLLKALAWQCAIIKEGAPKANFYDWTLPKGPNHWKEGNYPHRLGTEFLKGEADWDGEHAYLFRPTHYAGRAHTFDGRGDIEKFDDIRQSCIEKRSTGTEVLSLLERLEQRHLAHWATSDLLEEAIAKMEEEFRHWGGHDVGIDWRNAHWESSFKSKNGYDHAQFCKWLESLRAKGRSHVPTLMMDEPDEHLSPLAALKLYGEILPGYAAKGWQIIVVSHNPFALLLRRHGARLIEVGDGGFITNLGGAVLETAKVIENEPTVPIYWNPK